LDSVVDRQLNFSGAWWRVIYADAGVAGNVTGGQQWAIRVRDVGLGIYQQQVLGGGDMQEYIHVDPQLGDGWVVVVGVSVSGRLGQPSEPAYARLSVAGGAVSDDVTDVTVDIERRTVNGYEVIRVMPGYTSPVDMDNFWGVQLYFAGFHLPETEEIADAHRFPTTTGGHPIPPNSWSFDMPNSIDRSGTATFTNGSQSVVRVSGSTFVGGVGGMVGRPIFARTFTTRDGLWEENIVDAVADVDHLTMVNNFAGTTGVYEWEVPEPLIIYFVSLNPRGGRKADAPLTSPFVSL
jgi:hypothetical protein